jgi:hypothetical protein
MWSFQRIKRLYPLRAQTKKGNVEDRHRLKVPQYEGTPGWLLLTHNEDNDPVAIFVDRQEKLTVIHVVLDERMFSDTVLRVVRIGPSRFIVYDVRYLNGLNMFEKYPYQHRKQVISELLEELHQHDLVSLELPEDIAEWQYPLRGYEHYDDEPGSLGVFLPTM